MEDLAGIEFWVFFSLNLKQHRISEYKEKMKLTCFTLLMFVEGKKCIRSAGGEKEKENGER